MVQERKSTCFPSQGLLHGNAPLFQLPLFLFHLLQLSLNDLQGVRRQTRDHGGKEKRREGRREASKHVEKKPVPLETGPNCQCLGMNSMNRGLSPIALH